MVAGPECTINATYKICFRYILQFPFAIFAGSLLHPALGIDLHTKDWIMQPRFTSECTYAMKNLTAFSELLVYPRHTNMSKS